MFHCSLSRLMLGHMGRRPHELVAISRSTFNGVDLAFSRDSRTPLTRPCTDNHSKVFNPQPRSRALFPYSMNISEISKSLCVFATHYVNYRSSD
jgi:hypothetical protein